MANYYSVCRTNSFKVKNKDEFLSQMETVPSIEINERRNGSFVILGDDPDSAGWPQIMYDEDTGQEQEIDLPLLVSKHLADGEVAIFQEVGSEESRYLVGYAEAINNKGERRFVSINSIVHLAKELGKNVTKPEY